MVSSGTVNSDASSLASALSKFDSAVSESSSSWKGNSHDNFESKANSFSSEFSGAIKGQMSSFASACDLYDQYKTTKSNLEIARSNYNTASAAGESTSTFSSQISSYESELSSLKGQIEQALSSVKSVKLEASPMNPSVSASGKVTQSAGASAGVQGAIDWAMATAADDSHGYSQQTRWGNPNYDCSSFVISAYESAGIPVKTNGATYTGNMRSAFTQTGFDCYNFGSVDLQPGDVLLRDGYTEMYIGDGKNVGAHGNKDGVDGDSSGSELGVSNTGNNWTWVLRYNGEK